MNGEGRLVDSAPTTGRVSTIATSALTTPLLAILGVAVVVLVLLVVLATRRVAALERRLAAMTRGEDGASLERVLTNHLERVISLGLDVDELSKRTGALEEDSRRSIRRIGLVRYNPFEDTGSDQSFSLALLDEAHDGIIVSSLHTRGATRLYAKAITAGKAEATLSDEETAAVTAARDATLGRSGLRERTGGVETTRRPARAVGKTGA